MEVFLIKYGKQDYLTLEIGQIWRVNHTDSALRVYPICSGVCACYYSSITQKIC